MAYTRGPFYTANQKHLAFIPGGTQFFALTDQATGDLVSAGADIDDLLPDLLALSTDASDPLDDMDIGAALAELVFQEQFPPIVDWDSMFLALDQATELFAGAVKAAPAEAWIDPPAPFVPPTGPPALETPILNPADFKLTGASVVGQITPIVGQAGKGLSLINATVYGNSNFRVTDKWIVQATGAPGEDVSVTAWVNGALIGGETIGTIGADGRFEKAGSFAPGDEGAWREVWAIGGQSVATYSFIVSPE